MTEGDLEVKSPLEVKLEQCLELAAHGDSTGAIKGYREIVTWRETGAVGDGKDKLANAEKDLRAQERAIILLGDVYAKNKLSDDLRRLLTDVRPLFESLPKVRTAKIVRGLIDIAGKLDDNGELQSTLCEEAIAWSRAEKRTFLRHRVELRYAMLLHQREKYAQCLDILNSLLYEVKKLDDKLLLVEIHLIASRLHFSVKNIAKAKADLTASRTNANRIHCPPLVQAEIDLQSGILHAEEKDYSTSYSYFYESFEAFSLASDPNAVKALKYMLLAKIMCERPSEALTIATGPKVLSYRGPCIEALMAVAKSHQNRSLKMLEEALETFRDELTEDPIIERHISDIHNNLLEQNLRKILEPFRRVEIQHVAKLIDLPVDRVVAKLGEMVLDKKLDGTLDQGVGTLVLFERAAVSSMYDDILSTFSNLTEVVDALQRKAQLAV